MWQRLVRWLREPIRPRGDDWDWEAFSQSFGRVVGGRVAAPPKPRHSPAVRRWNEGGAPAPDVTPPPRWSVLLGAVLGGVFVALGVWAVASS